MATPASNLTAVVTPPQPPQNSADPTKDAPLQQNQQGEPGEDNNAQDLERYGKPLLQLAAKTLNGWEWKRRGIVQKVLKNKEMLKGNHHIGFYPGTVDTFDAFQEYSNYPNVDVKNGDQSIDRRPHNFYQMVENAFEAALSAQIPKNRWMPANADVLEDRETAKAASRVEEIIERWNKIRALVKHELQELFTSGCYFKYTRYVVDADRAGTHKQTTLQIMREDVLPARFVCFSCGSTTMADELQEGEAANCPQCGTPFSGENFYESHVDQVPVAQEQEEVASGMVLWDIYGPIHVDADPNSPDLRNTRLLRVNEEVSLGWLRQTFPGFRKKFQEGQTSGSGMEMLERLYRDIVTSPAGYSTWFGMHSQNKPSYSRTWFQPMAFEELDDENLANELKQKYPKGLMLASVGELPLQMREAKLTDEWTHCPAKRGFGLFPPPVGDPAVPIQERINDCIDKIDEYMDRLAAGILLANEQYIDTKAMNGKAMLPGLLNPVAFRRGAPLGAITDAIYQVKAEIDNAIFAYVATLKQDLELLVGTPPQLIAAGTQEGVDTFGGQKLQRDSGLMKLGLAWDMLREEHAEAAENAIKCASKNITEDWFNVVLDESEEFRNEYVRMDEMKGSVHAEPETDQGFPMTYAEIKAWFESLIGGGQAAVQILDYLIEEPENIDTMLRYVGPPGLTAPGASMRAKALAVIYQLVQSAPIEQQDPVTGQVIQIPSLQPNKYLDDLAAWQKFIPSWSQKHWDKLKENEAAVANLVAFFKMCVVYQKELAAEQSLMAPQPEGAPGSQPPPAQ